MKIIATVGPSSLDPQILRDLRVAGANDLRINLSHSSKESLEHYHKSILDIGIKPSLDTQGSQLRISSLSQSTFERGAYVAIKGINDKDKNTNGEKNSNIIIEVNHPEALDDIEIGDRIRLDFSGVELSVESITEDRSQIGCIVTCPGECTQNRAIDIVGKRVKLNHLTEFDKYAIQYGLSKGMESIYYSFAASSAGVRDLRSIVGKDIKIISKIESLMGLRNLNQIIDESDEILIDRGDLSREISISLVPGVTEAVVKLCIKKNKPVNIATNILDSMMIDSLPSRAEISDIWNLLGLGANGIVLAAEVAIGAHPVQSVQVIRYMMELFELQKDDLNLILSKLDLSSDLSEPLRTWL